MNRRFAVAVGLAVAAVKPPEFEAAARQDSGLLVGRVVDVGTGQGIAGASVRVSGSTGGTLPSAVMTTSTGGFVFHLPTGARITLRAQKPGFFGGEYRQWGPRLSGESLIVPKQSDPLPIAIPMWRAGALAGRVLDAFGDPVVQATVVAFRRDASAGTARFVQAGSTKSDDRGLYRISGIPPASYAVGVRLSQLGGAGFLVYAPSTHLRSAASIVSLGPGSERAGVDVVLPAERSVNLLGRLVGSIDWTAFDQVTLNPVDPDGPSGDDAMASVPVDQTGRFIFPGVPSGRYLVRFLRMPRPLEGVTQSGLTIAIRSPGQPVPRMSTEPTWWSELPVELGDQSLEVALPLMRGTRISGRVQFAAGTPQPPQDVLAKAMILVVRANGDSLGQMAPAAIDPDGRFRTAELPRGDYCIVVPPFSLQGFMTQSIEVAGRETATVAVGTPDVDAVSITLTARPAELHGTVMDNRNRPATDVAVYLFPTDDRLWVGYAGWRVRVVRSKQDGSYVIQDLPPGEYFAVATSGAPTDDWNLPDGLRQLAATAKRVSINEGRQTIQDFVVRSER